MSLHDLVAQLITAAGNKPMDAGLLWGGLAALTVLLSAVRILAEESRRRTLKALLTAAHPGTFLCDNRGRRNEILIVRLPDPPATTARSIPARRG